MQLILLSRCCILQRNKVPYLDSNLRWCVWFMHLLFACPGKEAERMSLKTIFADFCLPRSSTSKLFSEVTAPNIILYTKAGYAPSLLISAVEAFLPKDSNHPCNAKEVSKYHKCRVYVPKQEAGAHFSRFSEFIFFQQRKPAKAEAPRNKHCHLKAVTQETVPK